MKIVCMGDSITYGYGCHRKDVWTTLAEKRLKGVEIVNKGISGDTTGGMLARFYPDVKKQKADMVLIMGGGNDIMLAGSDAGARVNISTMAQHAITYGMIPVIGIPIAQEPPITFQWAASDDFDRIAAIREEYVQWLHHLCEVFTFCRKIDFRSEFAQKLSRMPGKPRDYYLDGVHLNPEGHKVMADIMVDAVTEIRNSRS